MFNARGAARTGAIIVGGRWVLCNKGDVQKPKVRGRWVATEVNYEHDMALYAATPPLEATRLLFSKFAQRHPHQPDLELSFLDVTEAYFHAEPKKKDLRTGAERIRHAKRHRWASQTVLLWHERPRHALGKPVRRRTHCNGVQAWRGVPDMFPSPKPQYCGRGAWRRLYSTGITKRLIVVRSWH